ncbi:MAG: UDP binding domain-containing protein, partial [Burkholderiaceae bacterium]
LIEALLKMGARVSAYDPVAMTEAQRILGNTISYAAGPMQALEGADALIIVTEWKEFRSPDCEAMASMLKTKRVFDGRNLYPPEMPAAAGLIYEAIGRKTV